MKTLVALLIVASTTACSVLVDTDLSNPTDTSYFYGQLRTYGEWTQSAQYGWVWSPRGVPDSWRPYFYGHWAYTDSDGWLWVSDEEWGWATYHYGRWYEDTGHWYWMPGGEWAPSWVAWRSGSGFIGWAPLPPSVSFELATGLAGLDDDAWPDAFCFVDEQHIGDDHLRGVILPPGQNTVILRGTTNTTNIVGVAGHVFNRSIPVGTVEKILGRPLPRVRVTETRFVDLAGIPPTGGKVYVFRPTLRAAAATAIPNPPAPAVGSKQASTPALQEVAARHAQEKVALESRHTQEIHNPPSGTSIPELKAQHATEHQQMETRQKQEVAEVRSAPPPPPPPPPPKPHS